MLGLMDESGVSACPAQEPTPTTRANLLHSPPPVKEEKKLKLVDTFPVKLANKIEDNYHLCNKKALLYNMKSYYESIGEDPFDALPVTFHIK